MGQKFHNMFYSPYVIRYFNFATQTNMVGGVSSQGRVLLHKGLSHYLIKI